MNDAKFDQPAQDIGYFIFMDRDEETILYAKGLLDNTINGHLVLTSKKLFFFFWTNINRDKKFIATYPYLVSAEIKNGAFSSTITVSSKKETFVINRMKKSKASLFIEKLEKIISGNK
jgi:hypothetical protein